MAGGMAIGAPLGVLIFPAIGWQGVMTVIAGMAALLLALLWFRRDWLSQGMKMPPMNLRMVLGGYRKLLSSRRAASTYGYVLLNSMFHSGIFTGLAVYLDQRYDLTPRQIFVALLGYGVPGLLLGPLIAMLSLGYDMTQPLLAGIVSDLGKTKPGQAMGLNDGQPPLP